MVNPSKMLSIFIIFCYFIHNSYPTTVQECINIMKQHGLILDNTDQLGPVYKNVDTETLIASIGALNITSMRRDLPEPLKTYVNDFSNNNARNGTQELPVAFCARQL
uniref:Uncharacterized protein n=1 Tax=Schizaphis graminum TaxID=13262 RepID=A0A2S2P2J3_SCHGA